MQAGTPVIATKVGEIPKILGQGRCGTLVGAGDSVGLAKAIEEVSRNKEEAEAKAAAAKDLFFKEYHVERMANKYLKQYQNLISQK
jgi:glycosyltransferase involved in cell wall biosynthesis